MFEAKAINVGPVANDGDLFELTCSRRNLVQIRDMLERTPIAWLSDDEYVNYIRMRNQIDTELQKTNG